MIQVKEGVVFTVLRPELYEKLGVIEQCFSDFGSACVITCACDGHPDLDPHSHGFALDFRTRDIANDMIKIQIVERLQERLGTEYFVQYEKEKEHIHIQLRKDLWRLFV